MNENFQDYFICIEAEHQNDRSSVVIKTFHSGQQLWAGYLEGGSISTKIGSGIGSEWPIPTLGLIGSGWPIPTYTISEANWE